MRIIISMICDPICAHFVCDTHIQLAYGIFQAGFFSKIRLVLLVS